MKIGNEELPRIRVSITLPPDIVEWIDGKVENRIYHNRSHAIEVLVRNEMKRKIKEEQT